MKTWIWQHTLYNDGKESVPRDADAFTITFYDDATFSVTTDCNSAGGVYLASGTLLTFNDIFSTRMYCENAQETEFFQLLENTSSFFFTNYGDLVFEFKYDGGIATFK
jgi:heat shock protein HslJ